MGKKICLDTDFLVNFLRGKSVEKNYVEDNEEEFDLSTTVINAFELFHGAYKSDNLEATREILSRLTLLDFSLQVAEDAGKVMAGLEKQGRIIDFRDLFIGMIAKHNGHAVKTNNKKHFQRIEGLVVE